MYRMIFKRVIDFSLALLILLLASPFIILIILTLLLFHQGSIFFVQTRPGLNENCFDIYKFKTMNDKRDANGKLLGDEFRTTRMGKVLRKFSLDELPQLINVLKGEMSLIGPRPLLVDYLPLYNEEQKKRHTVRPGITGWAQVNGRNAISWQQRFEYDTWYVENISFALDLKIIWMSFIKVIKSEGVYTANNTSMEYFTGNPVDTSYDK